MRKSLRFVGLATIIAGTLALSGGSAMAGTVGTAPRAYTCAGGDFASGNLIDIPSGNYSSITVTGACDVPADAVITAGNIFVAAHGVLDAQSAPSTITVGHNVFAGPGSLLGLGCQPDSDHAGHPCTVEPAGHSTVTVHGNVSSFGADTVLLNGTTVKGNVTLIGGGGDIPWAIKNNTIGENLTVIGVTADWLGVLFNHVGDNATLLNITVTDPGDEGRTVAVVLNTVGRNLICAGLAPGVSGGFIPGAINVVGGHSLGQCANLVGGQD
jgi:hypothetical protein